MPTSFKTLLSITLALTLVVIGLGAYVRLTDAGLGCPDWPGCYGQLLGVPEAINVTGFDAGKAWREMVHRYFAAGLGVLVLLINLWLWLRKQWSTPAFIALIIVVIQAALGAFTVTELLKPVIVSAHLLGGMSLLFVLAWFVFTWTSQPRRRVNLTTYRALQLFLLCVFGQIALGGWVSSNYAALACQGFPTCNGEWWPQVFTTNHTFELLRPLGITQAGQPIDQAILLSIHFIHRLGALLVAVFVALLVWLLWRHNLQRFALLLAFLTLLQMSLGIANVLWALPLYLAVAHNLGAAVLVLGIAAMLARLRGDRERVKLFL